MVFIPIDIACFGTFSIPPNSGDASTLVLFSIVTFLVIDDSNDPGSLKPM